jgi:Cys-rich protein (TIGR01571 family)
MALVCPGVSVAQICARLGFFNYYAVLAAFACLYILAIVAAATENDVVTTLIVIASLLTALFVARLRSRIRYLFSLPGSVLEDVLYACMCGPCTIAQMATHVESYQMGDCGIAPRATLPGYSFA